MRVLLVEDEIRLAENVAAALRDGPGFAVDLAEDGQIGLYLAKDRCYDLIILDLMLPKLDGLSLLINWRLLNPCVAFMVILMGKTSG